MQQRSAFRAVQNSQTGAALACRDIKIMSQLLEGAGSKPKHPPHQTALSLTTRRQPQLLHTAPPPPLKPRSRPAPPYSPSILRQRGITVLPDIYTNGGGVTVSFFEWWVPRPS